MRTLAAVFERAGRPLVVDEQTAADRGSVELVGVSRSFGGVVAVDDLSLTVRPGEFLSMLGPSGCGKTTTLRMLAGLEFPDSGEIRISGRSVADVPAHRRDVNTVFQAYALFPHMTVAENVAYGLRQRRIGRVEIRRRVTDALDMVQMISMAHRKPEELSGGQQQRVALVRALVNRPSVLLLDEPLAALDRKLREQMQIELKLLQTQLGVTFIFVTHDQGEALSMSDRIAVMLDGRIEQLADPHTIYEQPATAFVAGFIGAQNFFHGRVSAGAVEGDGWTIRASVPPATSNGTEALAAIRPESIAISTDPPPGAVNTVTGTLMGIAHLGINVQYVVSVPPKQKVVAVLPRHAAPRLEPGTTVHCSWDPAHVHTFDASQASLVLPNPSTESAREG